MSAPLPTKTGNNLHCDVNYSECVYEWKRQEVETDSEIKF